MDKHPLVRRDFGPDDATVREFELSDRCALRIECSAAGLVSGQDFRLASGAVLRLEERLVTIVPPLNQQHGEELPDPWFVDVVERSDLKRVFDHLWELFPETDKVDFLQRLMAQQGRHGAQS